MPSQKTRRQGEQLRKTDTEWEWSKRYRVWDANRRIFLYPENWIEPETRSSLAYRAALARVVAFVCRTKGKRTRKPVCRKDVRVLLTGRSPTGTLIAAQTLGSALKMSLYRIDLSSVVSKYIGETEKNLDRIFKAAKKSDAILFFDEADALFGRRADVKDSHDRYATIEVNYFLQRLEEYSGLTILSTGKRTNIDQAFLRRLRFVISIPPRRKAMKL